MKMHGTVQIPAAVIAFSDTIKLENNKVCKPEHFKIRSLDGCDELMASLGEIVGLPRTRLNFVYFSAAQGAEPHTDKLNPKTYQDNTYVIPVILPKGRSILMADDDETDVVLGGVYEFDHTRTHSMKLEDTESGCVVIMVAVKREAAA